MKILPSWLGSWWSAVRSLQDHDLGTIWLGPEAREAKSLDGGPKLRLCFRNHSGRELLLCWMDSHCQPHHFYSLPPVLRVDGAITKDDHLETTCTGHAFLLVASDHPEATRNAKTLEGTEIVGAYRPKEQVGQHLRGNKEMCENPVHLVTIHEVKSDCLQGCVELCRPGFLRKRTYDAMESSEKYDNNKEQEKDEMTRWSIRVRYACFDPTPVDSTNKKYELLRCDDAWTIYAEPNWHKDNPDLEKEFLDDLQIAIACLPPHARKALRKCTPLWLNRTLKYGPEACPVTGQGMCFHPGADWLTRNGMSSEKCHGIELYCADGYRKTRGYWAPGGLLLHELSHAYHNLCLPDGYSNRKVLECYEAAMRDNLYDCVKVHGPQGPTAKAYACQDAMEYFAELSVAFLGGTKEAVEFNKWFPFTRKQIQFHDKRAYSMLQEVWKTTPSDNEQ